MIWMRVKASSRSLNLVVAYFNCNLVVPWLHGRSYSNQTRDIRQLRQTYPFGPRCRRLQEVNCRLLHVLQHNSRSPSAPFPQSSSYRFGILYRVWSVPSLFLGPNGGDNRLPILPVPQHRAVEDHEVANRGGLRSSLHRQCSASSVAGI